MLGRITALERALERRRVEVPGVLVFCSVYNTTNQSVAYGTWTPLAMNTDLIDTSGMHDSVTNNSRIVVSVAGLYVLCGGVYWDVVHPNGLRGLLFYLNGSPAARGVFEDAGGSIGANGCYQSLASAFYISAGAYVELYGYQDNSSIAALNSTGGIQTFAIARVGP